MSDKDELKKLDRRISKLEKVLEDFMKKWGPEVQEARSRRDEVWDEMVRVVSIQQKNSNKK
tara:strand:- start:2567 stop:2749 length:183 start_codon:yes stop_codon:yes gene_type:complete